MNRKQILILSICISIATLMLIIVQIVWIENTRKTKERDFASATSIAMDRVIDAVSREETITHVTEQLPTSIDNLNSSSNTTESQKPQENIRYTTKSQKTIPNNIDSFKTQRDKELVNDSGVIEYLKKNAPTSNASNAVYNNGNMQVMIERIVEHIFRIDLPIEQRVTIEQVDSLIRIELKKSDIIASFETGITNANDSLLISSPHYLPTVEETIFRKQLFPNDPESLQKYYLNVYFPDQSFYILQSLWAMIGVSFFLTLIILTTFVVTLSIISKQKRAAEIRNAFVSNITHEFKTPIATISLASQMLQDENIPASAKNIPHLSQMVNSQSKQLAFLVEQILQVSMFNKGDYKLNKKMVDVHKLIKQILNNYVLQMQAANASVTCQFDANEPAINTDESHYGHIISNLLDNALKYSKIKGVPEIKITTMNKDNGILVSISDNGIGISKEYQKRIFEQFFRVPSGNLHDVKGFGLGLSYVKKITDVMGGEIWMHSEMDKGSTFYVWMPFKQKQD